MFVCGRVGVIVSGPDGNRRVYFRSLELNCHDLRRVYARVREPHVDHQLCRGPDSIIRRNLETPRFSCFLNQITVINSDYGEMEQLVLPEPLRGPLSRTRLHAGTSGLRNGTSYRQAVYHSRPESKLLRLRGRTVTLIALLIVVPLSAILAAVPAHAGGPTLVCPPGTPPYVGICLVIGQPDFSTLTAGQPSSPTTIGNPTAVAFDSKGDLWVVDNSNNRVLEYKPPFSTGEAASLVIGQTSLTGTGDSSPSGGLFGPTAIAFDSGGNLWVVDSGNNRVLEFKSPFSNGESATLVIGQPTFGGYIGTTTAGGLNSPSYLAFDPSGNLWVTDQGNNRVLEFTTPFSTGEKASVVIGHANFTAYAPSSTTTAKSLFEPLGIAFDSMGDLWVVDSADHRILEYSAPFSIGDSAASMVIGQSNFTTASSSTGLNAYAIAFDSSGNLWVSDGINGVAEYLAPLSTGETGSQVEGPKTVTGSGTEPGSRLSDPQGIAFDAANNLWVADYGHGRVVVYGSGVVLTTSSSSSSTTTSSTTGGGGVPVFPYQLATATVFTVLLAATYLFVRRGGTRPWGSRGE